MSRQSNLQLYHCPNSESVVAVVAVVEVVVCVCVEVVVVVCVWRGEMFFYFSVIYIHSVLNFLLVLMFYNIITVNGNLTILDNLTHSLLREDVYCPGARPYCGGAVNVTMDLALRQLIDLVGNFIRIESYKKHF